MCRGKKNAISGREEVPAGRTSLPGADQLGLGRASIGSFDRHDVNLIARDALSLVLEDEPLVVGRKIRLRILSAESELPHVLKVFLLGQRQRSVFTFRGSSGLRPDRHGCDRDQQQRGKKISNRIRWRVHDQRRCSSFTLALSGLPSRMTITSTTSPTLLRRSASVKS